MALPRRSRSSTTRPPAEQLLAGPLSDRLRSLLASDVYSSKGRLRRIRDLMGERRRYLEIQA